MGDVTGIIFTGHLLRRQAYFLAAVHPARQHRRGANIIGTFGRCWIVRVGGITRANQGMKKLNLTRFWGPTAPSLTGALGQKCPTPKIFTRPPL